MRVADDLGMGAVIAGFRVESLLGRGGMSTVYLAEDLRLKRRVALKVMATGLADDEAFREQFLRESELAASIDHPHIVPIYEAGESGEVVFIAMRYVQGGDLKGGCGKAAWRRTRRWRSSPRSAAPSTPPTRVGWSTAT